MPVATTPVFPSVFELVPLKRFAEMVDRQPRSIRLWHKRGIRNKNTGQIVKLNLVKIVGGYGIRDADYKQFIQLLNAEP